MGHCIAYSPALPPPSCGSRQVRFTIIRDENVMTEQSYPQMRARKTSRLGDALVERKETLMEVSGLHDELRGIPDPSGGETASAVLR